MSDRQLDQRSGRQVRVGQILIGGFALWRHFVLLYGPVFLLTSLPAMVDQYAARAGHLHRLPGHDLLTAWINWPVITGVFLNPLVDGALTLMCGRHINAAPAGIGVAFGRAIRAYPWLLLVDLGAALCTVLGTALFIIPGLICMTMFYVAIPCCILENRGPSDSLNRSIELTRGHRWKILGVYFLTALGGGVFYAGLVPLSRLAGPLVTTALQSVVTAAYLVFTTAICVACFAALKDAKEGASVNRLATVF